MSTKDDRHWRLGWAGGRCGVNIVVVMVPLLLIGVVCAFAFLPLTASSFVATKEVTFVARDMAFYLEGGSVSNPTVRLEAGEEVLFILRSFDVGITHNFTIEGWGFETVQLDTGASVRFRVRVPEQLGSQTYVCTPHRKMMHGLIEVVKSDGSGA